MIGPNLVKGTPKSAQIASGKPHAANCRSRPWKQYLRGLLPAFRSAVQSVRR